MVKLSFQAVVIVLSACVLGILAVFIITEPSRQAIIAIITAALLCLFTAMISMLPMLAAARRNRQWLGQMALAGTAIRLVFTLLFGLLLGIFLIQASLRVFFALWVVAFYVILLVWETFTALKMVKLLYSDKQNKA